MNIETAVSDDETEISTELETLSLEDSEVDNSEGVLSRSEIPEINVAPAPPPENSTGFDAKGAEYYFNFKGKKGLDFLDSGYWHRSYAAMVSHSTFQDTLRLARVLDVGCACGAILKGFKDSGIYSAVRGIDPNEYMVQLGRKELGFDENELLAYSGGAFPFHDSCFTLVHVSQVLEHITEEELDILLAETYRVLMPRADGCLSPWTRSATMRQRRNTLATRLTSTSKARNTGAENSALWDFLLISKDSPDMRNRLSGRRMARISRFSMRMTGQCGF